MSSAFKTIERKVKELPLFFLSAWATYRLTRSVFPLKVRILDRKMRFTFSRRRDAKVVINGTLLIDSWMRNYTPVFIGLDHGAELCVNGSLSLGPNVRISLQRDAKLTFGEGPASEGGITDNAIIIATDSIRIGNDFLGSWNLYITDSDHHRYGDSNPPCPVQIGNHVWMCPETSVMKGACIGPDSVIAQRAVVLKGDYPAASLIAGVPGKRIGPAKAWRR